MMEFTFLSGRELEAAFEQDLDAAGEVYVAVAWATASNPLHDALLRAADKVKALVVGLHFHQTDPDFIRDWRGLEQTPLRLVKDTAGVFHPKVYLFRKGENGVAIVGSANFTRAAFKENTEAMVRLSGPWGAAPFADLLGLVLDRRRLVEPTDAWLEQYSLGWWGRHSARRILAAPVNELSVGPTPYNLPALVFQDYATLIENAGRDRVALAARDLQYTRWLDVLDAVKELPGWPAVGELSEQDWDRVLGVVEYPEGDRSVDYRTFGWVRAKWKQQLLGSTLARQAIERIPVRGPVSVEAWRRFADDYTTAFRASALTTASRLLVLRRPDRFLSVNRRLGEQFEEVVGRKIRNLDDYWEAHQVIWSWPWVQARPAATERGRIWDARVALLDVLFYVPA